MTTVAMTGSDTASLNNRVLTDFADGNCIELTFPNEIANVKTGKNGNSLYGLNESGKQADLKMRIIRGSNDDKFLNNLLVQQQNNFAGTILLIGTFIKKVGDGQGNIASDTYVLGGGVFVKQVEAKSNVEGETDQSISEYTMRFANAPRAIS
jgi:hypothetical protein